MDKETQSRLGKEFLAKMMEPVEPENQTPSNSVFHPDNFNPVVLIQIGRLYDVGMALLSVFDKDKAVAMANLHANGEFATPPPAFQQED